MHVNFLETEILVLFWDSPNFNPPKFLAIIWYSMMMCCYITVSIIPYESVVWRPFVGAKKCMNLCCVFGPCS